MFRHATCCIEQIIIFVTFHEPWAFCIAVRIFYAFLLITGGWTTKTRLTLWNIFYFAVDTHHVLIQFAKVDQRISPDKIGLTIIVNHYRGVDIIPIAVSQWFADGIPKRSYRTVGYGYANGHGITQLGMQADIPIIFAPTFDGLSRPCPAVIPGKRRL